MLPRSRVISALLIGLGLALLVWGLVTPRFTQVGENVPVAHGELTYTLRDENAKSLAPAEICLLYTSPSPRDKRQSRMPSSA